MTAAPVATAGARSTGPTSAGPATPPGGSRDVAPRHDLPLLEAYRGLAALLVVLTHVGFSSGAALRGRWAGPLARLDFGVAVFFVLSGFLLFRPYLRAALGAAPPVRLRRYAWHRFVRLVPAYAALLVGTALLVPDARGKGSREWVEAAGLAQIYTGRQLLPGLTQTWSLATEVSFYVALPLLALVLVGRAGRRGAATRRAAVRAATGLGVLVVVAVGWRLGWSLRDTTSTQLGWLPGYLDWFAAGMGLALLLEHPAMAGLRRRARLSAASAGAWTAVAVAALWLVMTPLGGPYDLSRGAPGPLLVKHVAYLVAAVALLVPAVLAAAPAGAGSRLEPAAPATGWRALALSRPAQWLGRVSYGLFLWHVAVLEGVRAATGHVVFTGGFWWLLAATLGGGLLLAQLSWTFVEQPAQQYLRPLVR